MADRRGRDGNRFNRISDGWNILFSVILGFAALLVIIPMLLVVIVSFSSQASLGARGYSFFPTEWSLAGYEALFKMGDTLVYSYVITIVITVLGTLMSLSVSTMYAYVLSIKSFNCHKFYTWILAFTMLFGGGLVPIYILNVRYLHLNDTIWIFLLPSLASAYNIIMLRTFLNTTVPDSLIEAARIDGAGYFRVFVSIVLPLFKAGIATIALFNVVARWNDWFTGMLYIENPRLVPLQTLLQKIQNNLDFMKKNAAIAGTPDGLALLKKLPAESIRMSCTLIVVLPVMCAYPFFQRYFVKGLTVGSIKG